MKEMDKVWGETMGFVILFLIGFGLAVAGGVTMIIYLNLLSAGVTWTEYFLFVSGRVECYFLLVGFAMMYVAIQRYYKSEEK